MDKKKKRNLILTIIFSFISLGLIIFLSVYLTQKFTSKSDGQIEVKLIEKNNVLVSDKTIQYKNGDTLVLLLNENFDNVEINNGMIMSIGSLSTPSDWSYFICIFVNDEMSSVGINEINFENGTVISFVMTEVLYE